MVCAQICEIFINIIAVIHLNFVVFELLEVPAYDHFCDEVGIQSIVDNLRISYLLPVFFLSIIFILFVQD